MSLDPTTSANWPAYAAAARALKDAEAQSDQARMDAEVASSALAKANAAIEGAAAAAKDAQVQLDAARAAITAEIETAVDVAVATAQASKV